MATTTKQDYYEVALRLLAEGGAGRVTIANVCAPLGTTKGSFYHHFENASAFLHEALGHWRSTAGTGLAEAAREVRDPAERFELLRMMAVLLDHEAESAIRALGRTDPHVFELQAQVDQARRQVTLETLLEGGVPPDRAEHLADMGVSMLIGAQHLLRPVDVERVSEMLEAYRILVVRLYPALAASS